MKIGLHMRVGPADRDDAGHIDASVAGDVACQTFAAVAYVAVECRRTPHPRRTAYEMSETLTFRRYNNSKKSVYGTK